MIPGVDVGEKRGLYSSCFHDYQISIEASIVADGDAINNRFIVE